MVGGEPWGKRGGVVAGQSRCVGQPAPDPGDSAPRGATSRVHLPQLRPPGRQHPAGLVRGRTPGSAPCGPTRWLPLRRE